MPTGYTYPIVERDGLTFAEFVWRCARAMGVFIHMRDHALDAPLTLNGVGERVARAAGHCGVDCTCCPYGDGTVPADHLRSCDLITYRDGELGVCTCAAEPSTDREEEP